MEAITAVGLLLLAIGAALAYGLMLRGALTAALGVGAVASIAGYGMYIRTRRKPDLLATKLIDLEALGLGPDQGIDGWSLSHVLFFWVLGLLDPGRPLRYFALGAAWEGLETFLGQVPVDLGTGRVMLLGPANAKGVLTRDDEQYWYGRWTDLLMNSAGYALGSWAAGG